MDFNTLSDEELQKIAAGGKPPLESLSDEELRKIAEPSPQPKVDLESLSDEELRRIAAGEPAYTPGSRPIFGSARNWGVEQLVPDEKLKEISNATDGRVSVEFLRTAVPFYGGARAYGAEEEPTTGQAVGEVVGGAVGKLSESVLLGAPQWLIKKTQDPEHQQALDKVRKLVDDSRSLWMKAADFAVPVVVSLRATKILATGGSAALQTAKQTLLSGTADVAEKQAAKIAISRYYQKEAVKSLAANTGIGSAIATANSDYGEEVPAALMGGTFGLGLGVAGVTVGYVWRATAPKLSEKIVDTLASDKTLAAKLKAMTDRSHPDYMMEKAIVEENSLRTIHSPVDWFVTAAESVSNQYTKIARYTKNEANFWLKKFGIAAKELNTEKELDVAKAWLTARQATIDTARVVRPGVKTLDEAVDVLRRQPKAALDAFQYQKMISTVKDHINLFGVTTNTGFSWLRRQAAKLMETRFVVGAIDAKYGTKLEPIIAEQSRRINQYEQVAYKGRMTMLALHKEADEVGLLVPVKNFTTTQRLDKKANKLVRGTREETMTKLEWILTNPIKAGAQVTGRPTVETAVKVTPREWEVALKFKAAFDQARADAEEMGVKIPPPRRVAVGQSWYVPKQQMDWKDAALNIVKEVDRLGAKNIDPGQFKLLNTSKAFLDLRKSIHTITGRKVNKAVEFNDAITQLYNRSESMKREMTQASALFQRSIEDIPELIREKNVAKMYGRWVESTFKHLYYQDNLMYVNTVRQIARTLKDRNAADYLNNWVADQTYSRFTPLRAAKSLVQGAAFRASVAESRAKTPTSRLFYKGLSKLHDPLGFLASRMYANVLTSPRSFIRNLTQPWFYTVPYLSSPDSGFYGARTMLAAYGDLAKLRSMGKTAVVSKEFASELAANPGLRRKLFGKVVPKEGEQLKFKDVNEWLKNKGLFHRQFNKEAETELESGLTQGLKDAGKDGNSWINSVGRAESWMVQAAMRVYEAADVVNRAVTSFAAKRVSQDFLSAISSQLAGKALSANERAAVRVAQRMGSGYKVALKEAIVGAESRLNLAEAAVEKQFENHLIDMTQFNYDRAAVSEFGRSWGMLFAMFTKWPISVGSHVASELRRSKLYGAARVVQMYLAPYAMATAADHALELRDSTKAQTLLGKTTLAGAMPLSAIVDFFGGLEKSRGVPPLATPFVDLYRTGHKLATDADDPFKPMGQTLKKFAPGALGAMYGLIQDSEKLLGIEE